MKGLFVAGLVIVLIAGGIGTYLFLQSGSASTSSQSANSAINQSSSSTISSISQTQDTQRTTYQVANATVTANLVACDASKGMCMIGLVNTEATAVGATGCTLNGQPGVFGPPPGDIPPGGSVEVSCAPSAGGAVPIPGFHVEGFIQLSDGSSVPYLGAWS